MRNRLLNTNNSKTLLEPFLVSTALIILGLFVGFLITSFNITYIVGGLLLLLVASLILFRLEWGLLALIGSVFLLEYSTRGLLPYSLTVSEPILAILALATFIDFANRKIKLRLSLAFFLLGLYLLDMILST